MEVGYKLEWVGSEWSRVGCSSVIWTWIEMEVGTDKSGYGGMVWDGCMKVWVG